MDNLESCWLCPLLERTVERLVLGFDSEGFDGNLTNRVSAAGSFWKDEFPDWKSNETTRRNEQEHTWLCWALVGFGTAHNSTWPWCLEDTPSTSSEFSHPDVAIGHPWWVEGPNY